MNTLFEAYLYLEEMYYAATRGRNLITIFRQFNSLHFKVGYDPEWFVANFNSAIEGFLLADITFPDEFWTVAFLDKLPNMAELGTLYALFYNNVMSTLELQKYNDVKREFLQLDHSKVTRKLEKRANSSNWNKWNDSKRPKLDSVVNCAIVLLSHGQHPRQSLSQIAARAHVCAQFSDPVSYTHLTLPTIYSV